MYEAVSYTHLDVYKRQDERSIDEIRQLRNKLENAPKAILMFDQALFERLVDRVTVEAGNVLTFTLKGGMRLRERCV